MKRNRLDEFVIRVVAGLVAVIIVVVPFHAFLTVWGASLAGHYTALRLWEEVLLLPASIGALYLLIRDKSLRRAVQASWLWRLIVVYALMQLIWGAVSLHAGSVSPKALAYGLLIDLRFWLFFVVAYVAAASQPWLTRHWRTLVLLPAAIVIMVGWLQRFVLPHDVLKHFGYNDSTIPPFETIDHKVQYLRVQSTLRGANLLGAYMIIALSVILAVLRRYWLVAGMFAGLVVLFLSGSRGAWAGAAVAVAVLLVLEVPGRRRKQLVLAAGVAIVLVGAGSIVALRHNGVVENTFFHTDSHSRSSISSNAAHFSASRAAARQALREPWGRGPGTAGPASIYNTREPSRIAEDYFLQIAQEVGWLGLAVFLALYIIVGRQLWQRRADPLARALFSSLLGLSCVALLMHVWADETIAFLFWGLAGLALAPLPPKNVSIGRTYRKLITGKTVFRGPSPERQKD